LEDCLAAALDYERALARRQYRIRKFILNLQCKLDALEELSAVLQERRVA